MKMTNIHKIILSSFFLLSFAGCDVVKEDLEAAEANGKLEIIKQIKKVNDDGSYTIGYEADDGTFKIESRDVLGNIKGTYGYIDDHGEIKRVSYSTSNSSEILASTNEPPSVVQRIPAKLNRTVSSTTRRPVYASTTPSTLTTTSVIQAIPRRRIIASSSESTETPTTTEGRELYETSTPARILAQAKPLLRSTTSTQNPDHKEGQLLRPEVTLKPTDMPLYRRLPIKTTLLEEEKPVTEEPEVRGNLLRRQLPQEKPSFDPRQHVINIQQGAGDDAVDVYSSSVTTGSPRPLFTTHRPRIISTTPQPVIHRPTIRYPQVYQKHTTEYAQVYQKHNTEYPQESSTEVAITPSPPIVQIPANDEEPQRQPFVELRHPFHRGAILVPVQNQYPSSSNSVQSRRVQEEPIPVYVRRVPKFKPIPVHVDENGYVREVHARSQYVTQSDIINEVDQIKPPVSTRDFQKLLEQLILRQNTLEKISSMTHPAHNQVVNHQVLSHQNYQQQRFSHQQNVYPQHLHQQNLHQQNLQPLNQQPINHEALRHQQLTPQASMFKQYQYPVENSNTGPVQFAPRPQYYPQPNYHPTKRMVPQEEEYLPAPVREMLLLRMLQLAINPALPLELSDSSESATSSTPRKEAIRNVEILGEEDEQQHKRPSRTKRYKEIELDYFD